MREKMQDLPNIEVQAKARLIADVEDETRKGVASGLQTSGFDRAFPDILAGGSQDRRIDATLTVRDNEVVLIPEGYHPVVAAHGYNVYYLNALAGSARSMAASDDPDYAWVRAEWRDQDPRVPVVRAT